MAPLTVAALDAYRFASSVRLLVRRGEHALPPHGAGHAIHVTAVSRLPLERARAIADALQPLHDAASGHYLYPPETMHLTIRNLDGLGADALARAAELLRQTPAFEVELRGLNVSAETVFAQALPIGPSLSSLRRRLGNAAGGSGRPRGRLAAQVAHVNLIRFDGRVGVALLKAVALRRSIALGRLPVTDVEIVETDRLLSTAGTRTLERIALAAG